MRINQLRPKVRREWLLSGTPLLVFAFILMPRMAASLTARYSKAHDVWSNPHKYAMQKCFITTAPGETYKEARARETREYYAKMRIKAWRTLLGQE